MNIVIIGVIIVFISFRLKKAIAVVLILTAVAASVFTLNKKAEIVSASVFAEEATLVIDPGHGGRDGGAISANGAKESDINLNIALKMQAIADFAGIKTVLTRETDTDFAEDGNYSERNNLLDRVELINSVENAVLISVHQNKFPSEKVSGAEVMYAETACSEALAKLMQDNLVAFLDSSNRRVAAPAPKSLILTSSINCTGVLAECGFMSCPEEAEKLQSDGYQTKIAEIFIASFLQFTYENNAL